MKCYASKVINIALSEAGYLEKASPSQMSSKTANAGHNNWNKYADELDNKYPRFLNGGKNGYDWCTCFVIWCFIKSYGEDNAHRLLCAPAGGLAAGCIYAVEYYKNAGRFRKSPHIGDQIFFQDENGDPCHTGIVYRVEDGMVYTVEGNSYGAEGEGVNKKSYYIDSSYIYGYGHPDFDEEPVYYATKKACRLYNRAYKDPIGKSVASFSIPRGTKLKWLKDDGWGWSQVEYEGKKLWIVNANLKKSGLSRLKRVTFRTNRRAMAVVNGKLGKIPRKLSKGTTVKVVGIIETGDYAGYKLIKTGNRFYYL